MKSKDRINKLSYSYKSNSSFNLGINKDESGWNILLMEKDFESNQAKEFESELFIRPEFRKMGVGSKLMNKAISIAKENNARMIILETQSCNTPTIKFY